MRVINSIIGVFSANVYFVVLLGAALLMPNAIEAMKMLTGIDWIFLILIGAMTLGVFYLVFYMEESEEVTEKFIHLDANHDGFISRAEAEKSGNLLRVFDQADADHDGKLSRHEFEKALTIQ